MEFWIATSNKGKVSEMRSLFASVPGSEIHTQSEIAGFTPRPEDGKTFIENARIKAKTLAAIKSNMWVLGEDSGLEVEGLGQLPGIHSARYAGPHASDNENIAKLLKMIGLRSAQNRKARFVCALVVKTPNGEEWVFEGELQGTITHKPQGQMGFGYDPIFLPLNETKTMAELGPSFKNQNSHRAHAIKAFLQRLKSL